jgi:uncharacterized surface protein with fasciclin (FAS1) repeats
MVDIIDTAVTAGSFSTLVDAIKSANLIDTLKGVDSFIACPSTEEAFAKLPLDTVETLLKNINKLQQILTYHVVSGKVMPINNFDSRTLKIDPFYNVKVDCIPQSQHPMLLLITVSSTSLLISR